LKYESHAFTSSLLSVGSSDGEKWLVRLRGWRSFCDFFEVDYSLLAIIIVQSTSTRARSTSTRSIKPKTGTNLLDCVGVILPSPNHTAESQVWEEISLFKSATKITQAAISIVCTVYNSFWKKSFNSESWLHRPCAPTLVRGIRYCKYFFFFSLLFEVKEEKKYRCRPQLFWPQLYFILQVQPQFSNESRDWFIAFRSREASTPFSEAQMLSCNPTTSAITCTGTCKITIYDANAITSPSRVHHFQSR